MEGLSPSPERDNAPGKSRNKGRQARDANFMPQTVAPPDPRLAQRSSIPRNPPEHQKFQHPFKPGTSTNLTHNSQFVNVSRTHHRLFFTHLLLDLTAHHGGLL